VTGTRYFYLDASALAKRYTLETGTPVVNYLYARLTPNRFAVLSVGVAEVVSILVRKRNAKTIPVAAFSNAIVNFSAEIVNQRQLRKISATTTLASAALTLISQHSINATDAILLRSALDLAASLRARGDDLVLVASDGRLLRAAQAEGLIVFNPETQTTADLDLLLV
jgi:predicted nucleic acid-binding protein